MAHRRFRAVRLQTGVRSRQMQPSREAPPSSPRFLHWALFTRSEIGRVFSDSDDYARLQIDTCASRQSDCSDVQGNEERLGTPEQAFKLEDYSIQAELGDGTPLYVRAVNRKLTILLFS